MRKELLLGCGHSRDKKLGWNTDKPEWSGLTTLDRYPECQPDVIHDLNVFPYPFADSSFDEIHAYCVLEHCGTQGDWKFFFDQWAELYRIARPSAMFFGVTPRYNSPWAWGDPSHTRVVSPESLTFVQQSSYCQISDGSPMSDFRWYYKANWVLVAIQDYTEHQLAFVLRKE